MFDTNITLSFLTKFPNEIRRYIYPPNFIMVVKLLFQKQKRGQIVLCYCFLQVMALLVLAIMIAAAISKEVYFVHGEIGTATFYNPPYIPTQCDGNREEQFPPGNLFVAVSEGLWDNGAACGRRYRLRCLSGPQRPCKHRTIDVKVVDFCPITPCPSTMMLSRDAFAAIVHQHGRKVNIEYIQV